mmetsp:Transcript_41798/g.128891  ORF Transcript_41798/g.128891 Transcript_41798/m.128891 type:complete len:231 (+) Transcript_41798:1042-1734(+)
MRRSCSTFSRRSASSSAACAAIFPSCSPARAPSFSANLMADTTSLRVFSDSSCCVRCAASNSASRRTRRDIATARQRACSRMAANSGGSGAVKQPALSADAACAYRARKLARSLLAAALLAASRSAKVRAATALRTVHWIRTAAARRAFSARRATSAAAAFSLAATRWRASASRTTVDRWRAAWRRAAHCSTIAAARWRASSRKARLLFRAASFRSRAAAAAAARFWLER